MSGQSSLPPIRIEIGKPESQPYKSIGHIVWDDVPGLVVLTGLNGSGKTQLLEVLAYRISGVLHQQDGILNSVPIEITGDALMGEPLVYIPSEWNIGSQPSLGLAQMESAKIQLHKQLTSQNMVRGLHEQAMRVRLERFLGVVDLGMISEAEFAKRLPDDFAFMLGETNFVNGLTHVFVAYRLRVLQELEAGKSVSEATDKLGPSPWNLMNDVLRAADFPYRVTGPVGTALLGRYQLLLEDVETHKMISPNDLSSGEKVLMGLVGWLYSSEHHGQFPRVLLMDEPDAHLHPSMTRQFLDVVHEVLVKKYGVRTILSTHSPSTVAMAPENSVFEMSRTTPRIKRSTSRVNTIGLLTAGLVTVSSSTRYVLVEDTSDVNFYGAVRDLLTDFGPSRDPHAIKAAPSIVFLPASTGSGPEKKGGGSSVVEAWVAKFGEAPLDDLVRGVIDKDLGNAGSDRVYVIGRHSIENYLLDPLVVFGVLLDAGAAPVIPGVSISAGDAHQLRAMSAAALQFIVNAICASVEPSLKATGKAVDTTSRTVTFTQGQSVEYPAWALDFRGHDLLPVYQRVFGGPGFIKPPELEKSLRRVRLIPMELVEVMAKLQG